MADEQQQKNDSDRELLEHTNRLARENYEMLHRMRREAWIGYAVKIVVWLAILGVPVYLYFTFVQPVLGELQNTYQEIGTTTDEAQDLSDRLRDFLQTFGQ